AVGGGAHRPGAAGRGGPPRAGGRPRDPPDDGGAPRCGRVDTRRARAGAGHARPGPRARPGRHDRRRPAPAYPDPRPVGPDPRRRDGARMTDLLQGLLDDLEAEGDQVAATVDRLGVEGWENQTPAPDWTVATQVVHLMWTDEVAVLAARSHESPEAKQAWDDVVLEAIEDPTGYVDVAAFELA